MQIKKKVTSDPEDRSLQGMSMEITFSWRDDEMSVPLAVRQAIEMVVLTDQSHFRENRQYRFHTRNGRLCLILTEKIVGAGFSLAEALKDLWRDYMTYLKNDFDDMPYSPEARTASYHSKRVFLRRMELIDALLRIDFYEGGFWVERQNYSRRRFNEEVHDQQEQSVVLA